MERETDRREGLTDLETTHIGFREIPVDLKSEWVRGQFDAVARRYDFMNTLLSGGVHHLWKRLAVRMLDLAPGDAVLDLCGGTGDLAVLAKRRVGPKGQVVLCDINREMMRVGREKDAERELRSAVRWVQGDAERLPFSDRRFDAAVVGFGIRNLTRMEAGFAEMLRVLKPGGRMVCLEFSHPVNPLFRWFYDQYSFHVMPYIGELVTGSREAYSYLPESIRRFPGPEALAGRLAAIGYKEVTFRRLTNGVAVIHRGVVPGA